MVAAKVKQAMGFTSRPKPSPSSADNGKHSSNVFTRSFGSHFPRASAQVQPRPPEVDFNDLLNLVDNLRQAASIVSSLQAETESKTLRIDELLNRVSELSSENEKLAVERENMKAGFEADFKVKDARIASLMAEIREVKQLFNSKRFLGFIDGGNKINNNVNKTISFRKSSTPNFINGYNNAFVVSCSSRNTNAVKLEQCTNSPSESPSVSYGFRGPRVPKPPPKWSVSDSSSDGSVSTRPLPPPPPPPPSFNLKLKASLTSATPPPPPPPSFKSKPKGPSIAPPPPPPPPLGGLKFGTSKVKRMPEVVEFYHSLMKNDSIRDSCVGTATTASAKDLVGEIENRSLYLLAIKTYVETQGEFVRFLIKEVETAAFTNMDDVVSFVKWLDDELSFLVDERAVLKHFDWPELKDDALREAAFEYSDLRKLESEALSFRHDAPQACSTTLKKMQTLLEKLEHGAYNLSRLRESATNRFKSFHMPVDWMLDTGFVSQIKLASVKLSMKYMKRVSAELEVVGSGPEEEELIVQGVQFAYRVHQFAGGFDAETMKAFEELRDKASSYHVQCQNQQQQRLTCRSMPGG